MKEKGLFTVEMMGHTMYSNSSECWGRDRLILANQIQNLLVAMRPNGRFGAKTRYVDLGRVVEHPLLRQLKSLQRELLMANLTRQISEKAILQPFCDLCTSEEMSDTIVGVALVSLSNMIDLRCSFITEYGLEKLLDSVHNLNSEGDDISTYEVVLARSLQLLVSCVNHPSARALPEGAYVKAVRRTYTLAVHPEATPLLRRTSEQAMKAIVSSLYNFILENKLSRSKQDGANEEENDSSLTGVVMLHYLCNLIKGSDGEGGFDKEGQPGDTKPLSTVAAVQLEGLLMVQSMLFVVENHICEPGWEKLLYGVQHELCRALLIAGVSTENVIVFSQILRTVHIVAEVASTHVVPQMFSFIKALHLDPIMRISEELRSGAQLPARAASSPRIVASPLASVGSTFHMSVSKMFDLYERRELLLESLVEFCGNVNFAAFCYTHYDLSRRFFPLLDSLCALLMENCFYMSGEEASGASRRGDCDGIVSEFGVEGFMTQMDALALEAINSLLRQTAVTIARPLSSSTEITTRIETRLEQKRILMEFASLFCNDAVKEGIPFLLQKAIRVPEGSSYHSVLGNDGVDVPALVLMEPAGGREVGACLFHLSDMLDKRALGDYLGELGKEFSEPILDGTEEQAAAHVAWEAERKNDHLHVGTARFHEEQLKGFLGEFNYKNKSLLSCIRETAYRMCMPGEAQKIDRVMEAFSKEWLNSNRKAGREINPFCSDQGPFIIAFSLIMLNTDLHSGKMTKCMTQADFRRVHRDSDGGKPLPEEFLDQLYDDVKSHPIIMAEMINVGFANDVTWALEMRDHVYFEDMTFSLWATISEGADLTVLQALSPFIFSVVWRPFLRALSNTLNMCSVLLERHAMEERGIADRNSEGGQLITTAERAYNRALDGLTLIATTAEHFGIVSAVDHVILVFLSQLSPDMRDAYGSLVRLGSQRFLLRCLEKLLSVLRECASMDLGSWGELGQFFSKFFLMGMFAKGPNLSSSSSSLSPADKLELWGELYDDPGIVAFEVKHVASATGWLSAIWGSSAPSERVRAQEGEERRAMERVKAVFPTMEEFLRMIDRLGEKPHQQFFCALCEGGTMSAKSAVDSCATSYTMILITEVFARRLEDDVVRECYMKLCQRVTSSVFAILERLMDSRLKTGNNKARSVMENDNFASDMSQTMGSDIYNYWLSVATRVVKAVLRAVKHFVCGRLYFEMGLQLINMLGAAPPRVFNAVVASALSNSLLEIFTEPNYLPQVLTRSFLMGLLTALCVTATTCSHTLVLWQTRKAMAAIVKLERYNTLQDSEDIVNALVTCALGASTENEETVEPVAVSAEMHQETQLESFADIIASVCRRLVTYHRLKGAVNDGTEWHRVWFASLRGLCALVVFSRHYRDKSDALLCLQRCLLDSEIEQLSVNVITGLYEDVIFPLTEQVCAPPRNNNVIADNTVNKLSLHTFVSTFFTPFAPPPTIFPAKSALEASPCQQNVTSDRHNLLSSDLRCRIVGLLPKGFLHHVKFFGEMPEALQELWQRILGTLYALYTAPTECSPNGVACGAQGTKVASRTNGVTEEEVGFREAIEEAVKNMIFVFSATLTEAEGKQMLRQAPYFWISTKNLLRTFDFSEPLLVHIDSLES